MPNQPMLPFLRWLAGQQLRHDEVGELARAAYADPAVTTDTPDLLEARIIDVAALRGLVDALDQAADEWLDFRDSGRAVQPHPQRPS